MRAMFGSFGMAPFGVTAPMQPHRAPRRQVGMAAAHEVEKMLSAPCCWCLVLGYEIQSWSFLPGRTAGSLWHDGNGEYPHGHHFFYNHNQNSVKINSFYKCLRWKGFFKIKMTKKKSMFRLLHLKNYLLIISTGWRFHGHVWHDGRINGKHGE